MSHLRSLLLTFSFATALSSCGGYQPYDTAVSDRYTPPPQKAALDGVVQVQLDNCDHEITKLRARIETLESLLASFQEEIANDNVRSDLTGRLGTVEESIDSLQHDLATLVTHSNQAAKTLADASSRIVNLDNDTSRDIKNLETAMRSLMAAMQKGKSRDLASLDSDQVYKVRSGDSLGKIAKTYGTSVETLMQLNGLEQDNLIFIGQELRLPER